MRIVYSDSFACPLPTLKRLILLADEIAFMDRPSVTFGNRGTIGMSSPLRGAKEDFAKCGITLDVFSAPASRTSELFHPLINSDLVDKEFRKTILEGFKTDQIFAEQYIQPEAEYGAFYDPENESKDRIRVKGKEIIRALSSDPNLICQNLIDVDPLEDHHRIDTPRGRAASLKVFSEMISIQTSSALMVSGRFDYMPVSDSPTLAKLISQRVARYKKTGAASLYTAPLGLEILKATIPDEVLAQVDVDAVFEYRSEAKEAYKAWKAEIDSMSTELETLDSSEVQEEMGRLIRTKVMPKAIEYRAEMKNIADKMFGELIKKLATRYLPALAAAQYVNLGVGQALIAAAGFLVPSVVDYLNESQITRRNFTTAYVIDLVRKQGK